VIYESTIWGIKVRGESLKHNEVEGFVCLVPTGL